MKSKYLSSVAGVTLISVLGAAGAAQAQVPNWAGTYLGVYAGGVWGNSDAVTTSSCPAAFGYYCAPGGESLAYSFARKGSLFWLLCFAFALGFGTTVAEPALIAIAEEAATVAADGNMINNTQEAMNSYALGLRLTVAVSVGIAILVGVIRIIRGWPIHYLIIAGYIGVVIMTAFAPVEIVGIAYDSGGVTTSTITVPLVTALGVGLASSIKGRNPMIDGFGLIAFASLTPMIFVMGYGMFF